MVDGSYHIRIDSNIVTIPPGPHLLSDILATSPILGGESGIPQGMDTDGDFGGAAGGGAGGDGIDPNMDPELAMVSHTED
jgi:26S proteasome regulatory subunit N10